MKISIKSAIATILLAHCLCAAHGSAGQQVPTRWGTAVDPDRDCDFSVRNDTLTLTVPGSDHVLGIERGKTNAPRVLREVDGDFTAQVKLSAKFATNAISLVVGRRSFQCAGLLLWQDSGTYIRFEFAHMVADQTYDFASFELRREGRFEIPSDALGHPLPGGTAFLRLERRGIRITTSESSDGTHWNSVGAMTVKLPPKVLIGMIAGNNTSSPLTAEFSDFTVSPISNPERLETGK